MIDERLRTVVSRAPDRTAVVFGERRLSYRELGEQVAAVRTGLGRLGVAEGDRVLIMLPNCPEFVIGYFATAGLRAQVLALDPDATEQEVRVRSEDRVPAVVITDAARLPLVERLGRGWSRAPRTIVVGAAPEGALSFGTVARGPGRPADAPEPDDAPWVVTHSSGSTGEPKRIERSRRNQLAEADHIIASARIDGDDVILCPVPLFHALGQFCCMTVALLAGATLVLVPPGDDGPGGSAGLDVGRVLGLLRRHRVTVFPTVPYLLAALSDWPEDREADLSSVRLCLSGSNFLGPGVRERFQARFGVRVRQTYGSSEAGSVSWDCDPDTVVADSVGRPLQGVTVDILDEAGDPLPPGETGEIAVTSAAVMSAGDGPGPVGPRAAGRYLTGDLGRLDADGRLYVSGRKRILIDSGGHKVNPVEVEDVLAQHPEVAEAAVVGVPLPGGGDLLVAAVLPSGGPDAATDQEALAAHCARHLARHKVPARFTRVDVIPRTPLGKVRRAELAALLDADTAPGVPSADGIWDEPDAGVRTRKIVAHLLACAAALTPAASAEPTPATTVRDLGLDSLGALRLKMMLQDSLRRTVGLAELLSGTTVGELARRLAERPGEALAPLSPEARPTGEFPLSDNQLSIWHADQVAPESAAYNQSFAARITSGHDAELLRRTFQALVDQHAVLRTTFAVRAGRPFQRIAARARVDFETVTRPLGADELRHELNAEAFRPFALETEFPLRVRLYEHAAGGPVLLVTLHHIVTDFWSLVTMLRDMEAHHTALSTGTELYRPPQPYTYVDYLRWHARAVEGAEGERDWEHWRKVLGDPPPALELPLDKPRPVVQAQRGATHFHALAPDCVAELGEFARAHGTTSYVVLLAAFHVLLHGWTGEQDLALAAITTNRQRREFQDVLGYFVNPVVCRTRIDPEESFGDLLEKVRGTLLEGLEHQTLPFARIVERLGLRRERGRAPLVEVAFGQNKPQHGDRLGVSRFLTGDGGQVLKLGRLTLESVPLRQRGMVYDLSGAVYEADDSISLAWEYNTDLFTGATVARLAAQFESTLRAVLRDPERPVGRTDVLDPVGRDLLLSASRGEARDPGETEPVPAALVRLAAEAPEATALETDEGRLTRRELVDRAVAFAGRLTDTGAPPGAVCLLWLPHGADLAVAGLGGLLAGLVPDAVPVDTPPAQVAAAASRDGARLMVTTVAGRALLGAVDLPVVCADEPVPGGTTPRPGSPPAPAGAPDGSGPALVQHTSGVTGPARTAVLDHGALAAWSRQLRESHGSLDGVLVHGAVAPDRALARLLVVLAAGGSAVLTGAGATPAELAALLTGERHFALVSCTPTELSGVVPRLDGRPLRADAVVLGGEPLAGSLVRELREKAGPVRVLNEYGGADLLPVISSHEIPPHGPDDAPFVPVGRPVSGIDRYVLDATGRLCPPGVVGELCVSPSGADGPPQRTGDLAHYRPDGDVVVVGRAGDRTTVRGYRVEPALLEAAVLGLPEVSGALVVADADGGLVAHVVPRGAGLTAAAVQDALRRRVPEYMLPSRCLLADRLPAAANGKTARRPGEAAGTAGEDDGPEDTGAHMTPMEARLAAIWSEILGVPEVRPDDDYFDLDGDSITSLRIVSRAADEGITITPRQLFTCPVLRELAAVARFADTPPTPPPAPVDAVPDSDTIPLAPVQQWFFDLTLAEPDHWNQAVLLRTTGPADRATLVRALRAVADHHPVFRHRFHPPAEGSAWRQSYDPEGEPIRILEDVSSATPEETAAELHGLIGLEKGPLLAAAVRSAGEAGAAHVLLVAHHLVVDFVSWQIVVDDLTRAYRQLGEGRPVQLPPPTVPYARWTELLRDHAESTAVRAELDRWAPPEAVEPPTTRPPRPGLEGDARVATADVPPEVTARLLGRAGSEPGNRAQDLVLAAVVYAVSRWTGRRRVAVDVERHGRDDLFPGADPGRTVGWFTVMHPVRVELLSAVRPLAVHRAVQEELRRLPDDGQGYGLLRHTSADPVVRERMAGLPPATVNFNYLGRLGDLLGGSDRQVREGQLFTTETLGEVGDRGPGNARPYELEISAMQVADRLRLRVVHDADGARPPVDELLALAVTALEALAALPADPDH
ncbi:condensation domain-containing protein [Streptomyces sp. NPDC001381]|uniref:condensation domain-containing protein n=1 Tax=Streptomyces sp. NPDC001381 TaxID=3364567 RepID=UPI00369E3550